MIIEELTMPEFIFGELPIKNGSIHDQRMWIYIPKALSLIEVIPENETTFASDINFIKKRYHYFHEEFLLVIVQNNCELTEVDTYELLDKAWDFFCEYLVWEDTQ